MLSQTPPSVGLSVAKWHELAEEGLDLPVRFTVTGVSMLPLIRKDRDLVTVVPLRRAPRVGEVVLFRRRTRAADYVVHRVLALKGGMVLTLGDNCAAPDPWMPLSDIWGAVQAVQRGGIRLDPNKGGWRMLARAWRGYRMARGFAGRCARRLGLRRRGRS